MIFEATPVPVSHLQKSKTTCCFILEAKKELAHTGVIEATAASRILAATLPTLVNTNTWNKSDYTESTTS